MEGRAIKRGPNFDRGKWIFIKKSSKGGDHEIFFDQTRKVEPDGEKRGK